MGHKSLVFVVGSGLFCNFGVNDEVLYRSEIFRVFIFDFESRMSACILVFGCMVLITSVH